MLKLVCVGDLEAHQRVDKAMIESLQHQLNEAIQQLQGCMSAQLSTTPKGN